MRIVHIMNTTNRVKALSYCLFLCFIGMEINTAVPENISYESNDKSSVLLAPSEIEQTTEQLNLDLPEEKIPTESEIKEEQETVEQLNEQKPTVEEELVTTHTQPRRIKAIIISGTKHVPKEAILYRIPYKVGEIFNAQKTRTLIRSLYYNLKRFRNITVKGEPIGDDRMNLHIIVEEKAPLKEVIIKGNKQLSEKEIRNKIKFEDIPALDKEELNRYARAIKKLYINKGYHRVEIDTELQINDDGVATAIFTIREHKQALVKHIEFRGNHHFSGKKLRNLILTKEDWILSILDKSGTYHPDRLEADKYLIEQYYQSNGYLYAKVIDISTETDPKTGNITLVFEIQEGDVYTISNIKAHGNDILPEEFLLATLPIRPGDVYSREKVGNAIRILEMIWGNLGYTYAHIEPSVQPDDENKTVSVAFYSELGSKVFLNKLNIIGNKKTRDKIIRRQINLEEGAILTNQGMESSKQRVESLGYFEQRDGANWKMTRISEELADLDLVVQETKTGNANVKFGFGGSGIDITSPASGFSAEFNITDRNLFGSGIQFNLMGRLAKDEKTLLFSVVQPWLFDRPILGKLDIYHRRISYDDLHYTRPVHENHTGGALTTGFVTGFRKFPFLNDTFVRCNLAFNSIKYEKKPLATVLAPITEEETTCANMVYQGLLNKLFAPGEYLLLAAHLGQDHKNHPIHPSRGHAWLARAELAIASPDNMSPCRIGYHKVDLDFNWYTPLIDEYNLIFHLHSYCGIVTPFKNRIIPYRELYHIGGPASVRGFLFGQIGPQFSVYPGINDSIGGRKALYLNAELLFPITPDFNMKGVLFYDGGTGWDNPYDREIPPQYLRDNSFDYRHTVGFGIRIYNPMPIKVDWGFKLDPRPGENSYEVHFSTSVDW
ncbi:outer membrane protein assembly factor BamA [Candidatus Dependentiae bacterium]|nr:MAG: outer membrane protein assembly factor BamA [Candidatus Dependentiae bacterium]